MDVNVYNKKIAIGGEGGGSDLYICIIYRKSKKSTTSQHQSTSTGI